MIDYLSHFTVLAFVDIVVIVLVTASLEALKPWPLKLLVDHVLVNQPLPPMVAWLNGLPP